MDPLRVNARLSIPAAELSLRTSPSGGPGGQHANRAATRVELRFDVRGSAALGEERRRRLLERLAPRLTQDGVLIVRADGEREQRRNLADARRRLAGILREGLQDRPTRRPTRPTRGSRRRRLDAKRRRGEVKRDRRPPDVDR